MSNRIGLKMEQPDGGRFRLGALRSMVAAAALFGDDAMVTLESTPDQESIEIFEYSVTDPDQD